MGLFKKSVVVIFFFSCLRQCHADAGWDYEGQGAGWEAGDCADGSRQSPIDIISSEAVDESDVKALEYMFYGNTTALTVENNGHTMKVTPTGGVPHHIMVNGTEQYDILQFHFHSPSEHMFDGVQRDLELHIVHLAAAEDDNSLAVVGITFVKDNTAPENGFLKTLIDEGMPSMESPHTLTSLSAVDVKNLFYTGNTLNTVVRYEGSLTTPPCSEIVTWFVFLEAIPVPESQIAFFAHNFDYDGTDGNYRIVDPEKNPNVILTDVGFQINIPEEEGEPSTAHTTNHALSSISIGLLAFALQMS